MKIHRFHSWRVTPRNAIGIQEQIRTEVVTRGRVPVPILACEGGTPRLTRSRASSRVVRAS